MRRLLILLITLLSLSLSGCGLYSSLFGPTRTSLRSVRIVGQLNANQNMSATVDMVFIYDNSALTLLPNKSTDWFANRSALQSALGSRIDVVSQQVPPARTVDVVMPSRFRKALTVYSYVDYIAGNQGVTDLTAYRRAQIQLEPATVTYSNR